jgi:hypothetical protein
VERFPHRGRARHSLADDTRFNPAFEQPRFRVTAGIEIVSELPRIAHHLCMARRLLGQ